MCYIYYITICVNSGVWDSSISTLQINLRPFLPEKYINLYLEIFSDTCVRKTVAESRQSNNYVYMKKKNIFSFS